MSARSRLLSAYRTSAWSSARGEGEREEGKEGGSEGGRERVMEGGRGTSGREGGSRHSVYSVYDGHHMTYWASRLPFWNQTSRMRPSLSHPEACADCGREDDKRERVLISPPSPDPLTLVSTHSPTPSLLPPSLPLSLPPPLPPSLPPPFSQHITTYTNHQLTYYRGLQCSPAL